MLKRRFEKSKQRQQSDIVINPDGSIHISFLWNDLKDFEGITFVEREQDSLEGKAPQKIDCHSKQDPSTPQSDLSHSPISVPLSLYSHCELCPKKCGFDRLNKTHPRCGDWNLRIATAGLSLGDEPAISGTRGSGTIMLSGCPLKCPSCQNPEMVHSGEIVTPDEFVTVARRLADQGAHNLQILSPTVHFPALLPILSRLKETNYPIPILFKSSGFEEVSQLSQFEGLVDIYLPDFKFGSCSSWAARAGVRNYFEIAGLALQEMIRQVGALEVNSHGLAQKGVLVRHVRAPLPKAEQLEIDSFLASLPSGVAVSVLNNFVDFEN